MKLHFKKISEKKLKVQSWKLCNNRYMMALTQIKNTEVLAFIAVPDFKILSR